MVNASIVARVVLIANPSKESGATDYFVVRSAQAKLVYMVGQGDVRASSSIGHIGLKASGAA